MNKLFIISQMIIILMVIALFNPLTNMLLTYYYGKQFSLNTKYFYKQIEAESSFRCFAYSSAKAIGVGQITYLTAKYMDSSIKQWQLWLPWVNIQLSAQYTQYLLHKYKNNYSLALAAYNWGETNVDNKIKYHQIHISSNINYGFLFKNVSETDTFLKTILD
ncbi:MAG TPA: lytic transglycosylase domain-containing protein [Candidatus Cloacimonadota bacterium]|nr:lytic transglycosylase domain-containing protein [Candidatus Cloacimonadota bacterium]HOQ80211.1 lytic transglycosylase domain-containing protein [Candidatus Cloacimonadota bacterium]HPK40290.1 lytic transglycosylase domain-containing protein [Candidatus Cloacimonadota bacterium]